MHHGGCSACCFVPCGVPVRAILTEVQAVQRAWHWLSESAPVCVLQAVLLASGVVSDIYLCSSRCEPGILSIVLSSILPFSGVRAALGPQSS